MCFSATASFTAAAILVPAGMYCLKASNHIDKRYRAFAMLPFMFGMQQLLEGGVWVALLQGDGDSARSFSLGFLLFSHVFWLGWIAYSAYLVEPSARLRRVFIFISLFGILFGAFLYAPLLLNNKWMVASIVNHSIDYSLVFMSDAYLPQEIITILYAMVILVPLILSSDRYHSRLGVLTLIVGFVAWGFYDWAFISVWCYFSAVISLYVFFVIAASVQAAHASDAVK